MHAIEFYFCKIFITFWILAPQLHAEPEASVTKQYLPNLIHLAATEWCPHSCGSIDQPGIVHELLAEILARRNIKLKVSYYPWTRALRETEIGRLNGLLTAVPAEAPTLSFNKLPISNYTVCFIGRKNSDWKFKDEESLTQIRMGVIKDYSYGEPLDNHIKTESSEELVQAINGDNGIRRLFNLLDLNRIESFADDYAVVKWEAKKAGIDINNYTLQGCMPSTPFYLALNSQQTWNSLLLEIIDNALAAPETPKLIYEIREKYQ